MENQHQEDVHRKKRRQNKEASLPFLKTRQTLWDEVESRKAFHKVAQQNPHFRPLHNCPEYLRETRALYLMSMFADFVDKVSSMSLDESRETPAPLIDALADLEPHGFIIEPIRGRLNDFIAYKVWIKEMEMLEKRVSCLASRMGAAKTSLEAKFSKDIWDF